MGSLEEEKLLTMVRDFIESESTSSSSLSPNFIPSTKNHVHFRHSTTYFTLQNILRKKTEEEKVILEKVEKYMRNKMELEKTTGLKQWLAKCLKMDGLNASLCHTSWVTTPACPSGNYEFIEIEAVDEVGNSLIRIIVDIDFKSQFEVARPTQSYTELLSKLPTIFVGSEEKIKTIIPLLCSAAEESLRERGLHIPPWRRPTYMESKWKLSNYPNNNNNINIKDPNCKTYPTNLGNVSSKFGKWVPPDVMMKGRRRDLSGGGSGLSNQFSNMSINCC